MRALPNVRILSPSDHVTASALFDLCLNRSGIKYLRLDAQVLPQIYEDTSPDCDIGFHVHAQGDHFCLLATGFMLHTALSLAKQLLDDGISIGVIDIFDITGVNPNLLPILQKYQGIITMEEGFKGRGGMDAMFFDEISRNRLKCRVLNIGVEPGYRFELGTRSELHEKVGIGNKSVKVKLLNFIQSTLNE
jgi:transketolase